MPALPGPSRPMPTTLGPSAKLTYKSGAGFLAAPNNFVAAVFNTLADLEAYWKSYFSVVPCTVYSMNGVSSSIAVCVELPTLAGTAFLLYTAASWANNGWYYVTDYLNGIVGAGAGPAVTGLKVSQYVVFSNGPDPVSVGNWMMAYGGKGASGGGSCKPDMSKLTLL
jgi:hypothetical protein